MHELLVLICIAVPTFAVALVVLVWYYRVSKKAKRIWLAIGYRNGTRQIVSCSSFEVNSTRDGKLLNIDISDIQPICVYLDLTAIESIWRLP